MIRANSRNACSCFPTKNALHSKKESDVAVVGNLRKRFISAKFLVILSWLLMIMNQGCKTTSFTPATGVVMSSSTAAILDSMNKHAFHFEWFTGRAKVEVTDGSNNTSFTANIRMRADSAIWVSVSALAGLEAVRVLMTKDSVRVIDRINNESYSKGYDFFQSFTALPVTFQEMQDLIRGVPLYATVNPFITSKSDTTYRLEWNSGSQSNVVTLNQSYLLTRQLISDSSASGLSILQEYEIPYTSAFSLWRKIELQRPHPMQISITFSKIKIDEPVKLPFSVNE